MTRYIIYNDPDNHNAGSLDTPNFSDVPEGAIEGYHYDIIILPDPDPNQDYIDKVSSETTKYINRITDGQSHHAVLSAKIRAASILNKVTPAETFARISFYEQIRPFITMGWHDKALEKINEIGSESVDESFYNDVFDLVNGYVDASFNSNFSKSEDIGGGGIKNPKP